MFKVTHYIQTGTKRVPVCADSNATCGRGAALYTRAEWDACDNADWELNEDGELQFQGSPRRARELGASLEEVQS